MCLSNASNKIFNQWIIGKISTWPAQEDQMLAWQRKRRWIEDPNQFPPFHGNQSTSCPSDSKYPEMVQRESNGSREHVPRNPHRLTPSVCMLLENGHHFNLHLDIKWIFEPKIAAGPYLKLHVSTLNIKSQLHYINTCKSIFDLSATLIKAMYYHWPVTRLWLHDKLTWSHSMANTNKPNRQPSIIKMTV